jgi:hypothetical protein
VPKSCVRSLPPWLTFLPLLVATLCCWPDASGQQARNGAVTGALVLFALVLFALVLASEPGYARDGAPVWRVVGSIPGAPIAAAGVREAWLPVPLRSL